MTTYTNDQVWITVDVLNVLNCALDFYQKYDPVNQDFILQMENIIRYCTSQYSTFFSTWNLYILTNLHKDLKTRWDEKQVVKKDTETINTWNILSLKVGEQMYYDIFKILADHGNF